MRLSILCSLVLLSACATVTAESDQNIAVSTTPAGATCLLSNGEGSWRIPSTPGTAVVKRAFQPLQIRCTKAGAGKASTTLEAGTRNRAYGNILLLGAPALVDAYTGKGYEYEPGSVSLTLTP